ncbi:MULTISPECIES: hypothetical protein [Paenibacillus]|uniref:hypothetical protein n=1 Tax=Paenibacillus TaxID=44249 RepID=UPI0015C309FE|nr:hypothetical protein [Paenibacillus lautus]
MGTLESKNLLMLHELFKAGIAKRVKDFQDGRIENKTVDEKLIEIDIELQKDEL